jgi:hypothetical protein
LALAGRLVRLELVAVQQGLVVLVELLSRSTMYEIRNR